MHGFLLLHNLHRISLFVSQMYITLCPLPRSRSSSESCECGCAVLRLGLRHILYRQQQGQTQQQMMMRKMTARLPKANIRGSCGGEKSSSEKLRTGNKTVELHCSKITEKQKVSTDSKITSLYVQCTFSLLCEMRMLKQR